MWIKRGLFSKSPSQRDVVSVSLLYFKSETFVAVYKKKLNLPLNTKPACTEEFEYLPDEIARYLATAPSHVQRIINGL